MKQKLVVVMGALLVAAGCYRAGIGEVPNDPGGTPQPSSSPNPSGSPTATPTPAPAMQYTRTLTIAAGAIDADLADFPVLVDVLDATLAHVDQGGHVEYADGSDIVFRNAAAAPLDFEIEEYDEVAGLLRAWVRLPQITAAADTVFYLYYGDSNVDTPLDNPTGVWDGNFVGVWHMSEAPNNNTLDSTDNSHDGNPSNMQANDLIPAVVGTGLDFDGNNDSVSFGDSNDYSLNRYTFSMWIRGNAAPANARQQALWNADVQFQFNWGHSDSQFVTSAAHQDFDDWKRAQSGAALQGQTWYHVAGSYDGNFIRLYVNGTQVDTGGANNPRSQNGDLIIGGSATGQEFPGRLDELRISSMTRSAAWIAAEYDSMVDPAAFAVLGAEVELPE